MEEFHRKVRQDIETYGCSVLHIAAEGDLPPFAYSVGITKSASAPEVVVIGLKQPMAHFVVNEYNRRVRAGDSVSTGKMHSGFVQGFDLAAEKVDPSFYEEYFGYNLWFNQGPSFEVVQLVYPNTSGVWPWQPEASAWFKSWQPILTSNPTFSMKPTLATRKPVEDISVEDLETYPVWEFAWDEEGSDEQDETWVRPIDEAVLHERSSLCAGAAVRLANGLVYPAVLFGEVGDFNGVALLTVEGRVLFTVADSKGAVKASLKQLGLPHAAVFPMAYSTRAPLRATGQPAMGTFQVAAAT